MIKSCSLKWSFLQTIQNIVPGFDNFAEEVGISRDSSLKKEMSLDVEYDEKDRMKVGISTFILFGKPI